LPFALGHIEVLEYPCDLSRDYAEIRAYLTSDRTPIGGNHLLIAAHARCASLALVTNKAREFNRVPGLTVENWA